MTEQSPNPNLLLAVLCEAIISLVRADGRDLTTRQLAVFFKVYTPDGPRTVRDLAAGLNIHKPGITRALDRLGELGLTRRVDDPADRRSVRIVQTEQGVAFLGQLRRMMVDAERIPRDLTSIERTIAAPA